MSSIVNNGALVSPAPSPPNAGHALVIQLPMAPPAPGPAQAAPASDPAPAAPIRRSSRKASLAATTRISWLL
ncbi:hypothetical protein K449DRAFT_461212, partial [Hypoxylon sp. EC38]